MVFPFTEQPFSESSQAEGSSAAGQAPQAPGGAPEDAESGNTASHNCKGTGKEKETLFQVVWRGVDTLELTYAGQIHQHVGEDLARLKACAQAQDAPTQALAQLKLGERYFEVADKSGGRFFAYLLRHPDMRVVVASAKAKRIPLASVTLQNLFLVTVGPEAAEAAARSVVEALGVVEGPELVKRIDLAADVASNEDMAAWSENAWVIRADRLSRHTVNGRFTGWSVGLGADVSARVYDKKAEIGKSDKAYFLDLWDSGGWFPADPVIRIEHQFRRNALAQFGLRTLADVLWARPALWAYATREWAKLTLPNLADETRARWPLHPFWERVQGIQWDGNSAHLPRRRPSTNAPSDRVLARMFKAVATAVMAKDGLTSLEAAAAALVRILTGQLQHAEQWEGASPEDLLMEAVMLKRRKYCLPVKSK